VKEQGRLEDREKSDKNACPKQGVGPGGDTGPTIRVRGGIAQDGPPVGRRDCKTKSEREKGMPQITTGDGGASTSKKNTMAKI